MPGELEVSLRTIALIGLLTCSAPLHVSAQGSPTPSRLWLSAGLGAGTPGEGVAGVSALAGIAYHRGSHQFRLRGTGTVQGEFEEEAYELGLLYGRGLGRPDRSSRVSVALGLSVVEVNGGYARIGVPIAFEVSGGGSSVGFGLHVFANVNSARSFGGVVLILNLGLLR